MKRERTTKEERKENARCFYQYVRNSTMAHTIIPIVVDRLESTSNPYVQRTRLLAVIGNMKGTPKVIAESASDGVAGCFYELLSNIKDIPQVLFHDSQFSSWMRKNYGLQIKYNDGLVIILEGR